MHQLAGKPARDNSDYDPIEHRVILVAFFSKWSSLATAAPQGLL
jgi:hypothetical protein